MDRIKKLAWLPALSTVFLFLVAASLAIHVRLGLGRWPLPNDRSIDTAIFWFHEQLFGVTMLFAALAIPLWVLLIALPATRPTSAAMKTQGFALISGLIACRLLDWADPGGAITYIFD